MTDRIADFETFWPFYLGEHKLPVTRWMHFAGTTMGFVCAISAVAFATPLLFLACVVCGYAPAWVSHFFLEKNRPASFKYPLWSFRGDMRMWWRTLTGAMPAEMRALGLWPSGAPQEQ